MFTPFSVCIPCSFLFFRGVEQDFEKSYQMFELGAELLDLHSTSLAANLLMRGAGTSPDYKEALRMFSRSKASGQLVVALVAKWLYMTSPHAKA